MKSGMEFPGIFFFFFFFFSGDVILEIGNHMIEGLWLARDMSKYPGSRQQFSATQRVSWTLVPAYLGKYGGYLQRCRG